MPRLIVGMTGASGAALGVRLLEALRELPDVENLRRLKRNAFVFFGDRYIFGFCRGQRRGRHHAAAQEQRRHQQP